ncbi:MAG: helix-turn-helix domain-containing protein [Deltaproteobacteria bacterium]|nr:helix-turn-helix domain-containing protein [Deltaproteobacteria bacterium]MBI5810619.1 helix-turn-helix domain-containing protein [Deltaproteobacteria bacterium]
MLKAGSLKNSSELAKVLAITPQAISNYKKRGEMPASLVFKFAEAYGLSVDWLLTGFGAMRKEDESPEKVSAVAIVELPASSVPGRCGQADDRVLKPDPDDPVLKPDEVIYIKKLIRILRTHRAAAAAIKASIDAFGRGPSPEPLQATEPRQEPRK